MSRYFGLVFVCALSAGCSGEPIDMVRAAELDGAWSGPTATQNASQCRLDVTTQVNTTKVVGTYSTFTCEGSPSDVTARR